MRRGGGALSHRRFAVCLARSACLAWRSGSVLLRRGTKAKHEDTDCEMRQKDKNQWFKFPPAWWFVDQDCFSDLRMSFLAQINIVIRFLGVSYLVPFRHVCSHISHQGVSVPPLVPPAPVPTPVAPYHRRARVVPCARSKAQLKASTSRPIT